jgi:cytochrome c oxidase subunit 2
MKMPRAYLHCIRTGCGLIAALAATVLLCPVSRAATPMAYTTGFGTKNYPVVSLLWALIGLSLFITVIVGILILAGIFRRRSTPRSSDPRLVPLERSGSGLSWVYIGTALSTLALLASAAWTFDVLGAVAGPEGRKTAFTIHITGHQWWWEAEYDDGKPADRFATANEFHVPTGKPVRLILTTSDVIHSFWVPALSGKMDMIPNQHNETWIEADTAGTYRGQCTEFCGLQHAHMALAVIAESPERFQAWWQAQVKATSAPENQTARAGEQQFMDHCAVCHTIRGTQAGGYLGPDLTHLMSRTTIAAGTLPNTPGNLLGWVADPQRIKPGNLKPAVELSGSSLTELGAYLETLH